MALPILSQKDLNDNINKAVADLYFKDKRVLSQHHLNSYNYFIENQISEVLDEYNKNQRNIIKGEYDKVAEKYLYEYHIKFGTKPYFTRPMIYDNQLSKPMYPQDAREQRLTYSSILKVDIYHKLVINNKDNDEKIVKEYEPLMQHTIGKIPIMLHSNQCILSELDPLTREAMGECRYDLGGYFVVDGSEKIIVQQERKAENKIFVFKQSKSNSKFSHIAEISSINEETPFQIKNCEVKLTVSDPQSGLQYIRIKMPHMRQELPLFVVFRALGVLSDKDICEKIFYNLDAPENQSKLKAIRPSLDEASTITSQKSALEYISRFIIISTNQIQFQTNKYKLLYVQETIREDFLPHVGDNLEKKAFFLGKMVNRLLTAIETDDYDDRDNFMNKRVDTSGSLMAQLFRANFMSMIKEVEKEAKKELKNNNLTELQTGLPRKIKKSIIESGLKHGLLTGDWGIKTQFAKNKKGIAQVLKRLSQLDTVSHTRRVQAQINKTFKNAEPHKLKSTQWGICCPAETPEGLNVGVVKNMAMTSYVTIPSNSVVVRGLLQEYGVTPITEAQPLDIYKFAKIFVNGDLMGIYEYPYNLTEQLKERRREGIIHPHVSITWNIENNEIFINSDAGRMGHILLRVKDNKLLCGNKTIDEIKQNKVSWHDLIIGDKGCVEYLDVTELNSSMVAIDQNALNDNKRDNDEYYDYTHMELHPTLIVGSTVSTVILYERNQAPRVLYFASQAKQGIGIYATNYNKRFMDTNAHVSYYVQRPLVSSYTAKYINFDKIPSGQNCILAVAQHTGFNQEDSLIINQTSCENGIFVTMSYHTYFAKEQKNESALAEEKFCKPEKYNPDGSFKTIGMREGAAYDKLTEDGYIPEGTAVESGDILIGKVIPLRNTGENDVKYRDSSTEVKNGEEGVVDKVYVNKDEQGFKFMRVRIRTQRIPEIGDKFTSRSGQKGTTGTTYTFEDMPFTREGIVPDVIMNPLALPSRMTTAQLIETTMGLVGAINAYEIDGTAFTGIDVNDISKILLSNGYERYGTHVLYNGRTGEQIASNIFMGPTYYMRLKHMVKDKIYSRARGPYTMLTRQATDGRARNGGLRIGEMERDSILSHGTMMFLRERMFDMSDKYFVYVCKNTGKIAAVNPQEDIYRSFYDNESTDFVKVQIPYATKLFMQELEAMGINTKLEVE